MCGGQSAVSARPLLAALEDGHTSGGIEVDIGCLRQACHRHVEADCEDGFDDLLFAEMRAHGGKHRLGDTYVLDDFPTERQQRLFGGINAASWYFPCSMQSICFCVTPTPSAIGTCCRHS